MRRFYENAKSDIETEMYLEKAGSKPCFLCTLFRLQECTSLSGSLRTQLCAYIES